MARLLTRAAISLTLAFAASTAADQGVLEINSACALGPGCFPQDTAGLPVQIMKPGSYRLTSNLSVPNENTSAILISTPQVTLDLGGYSILGPINCSGSPTTCTPNSGTGRGVDTTSFGAVIVRNGHVNGMGEYGLDLGAGCIVENVTVSENRRSGIRAGAGCVISRSTASSNGEHGMQATTGATFQENTSMFNGLAGIDGGIGCAIRGNTLQANGRDGVNASDASTVVANSAFQNGEDGIDVGAGSVVSGNSAFDNGDAVSPVGDDGIQCIFGCLVHGNSVRANSGTGLRLSLSAGYRENVVTDNLTDGVSGGTNLGDNYCAGVGVGSAACP